MSNSEIGTAIVYEVCPICGSHVNEGIIMNTKLNVKEAENIRKLHNKCIGVSKDACDKCLKYKDQAVYFIAIDPYKGSSVNPFRTGKIAGISKSSSLVKNHPEFILTTNNGVSYCFIEESVGKELGIFE